MSSNMFGATPRPVARTSAIIVVAALFGALAGGAVGLVLSRDEPSVDGDLTAEGAAPRASSVSTGPALTPEQIYRQAARGVVPIFDMRVRRRSAAPSTRPNGKPSLALGSGFVVDGMGDIVTNAHVVRGVTSVRVGFGGGRAYPARILGFDASTDLAVLRVDAPEAVLHPLTFGDSAGAAVGNPVYTIGSTIGAERAMSAGIVSARRRDIRAPDGSTIPTAIQIDAPINHGNSGGPLLDRFGRVIGVTTQLGGGAVDGGVGFAIPGDTARSVASELIATGRARHAWLGLRVETVDPSIARVARELPSRGVTVVRAAPGGPAASAGLVSGDSITKVDGDPVSTPAELVDSVAQRKPGDTIALEVVRGGTTRTVRVTLRDAPG